MKRLSFMTVLIAASAANAGITYGESARSFMLELKGGPWIADMDRGFPAGTKPYETIFGASPALIGELELDYQVLQRVGSLGVGISGGYAEKFGESIDSATGAKVGTRSGLHIVPIKLMAVYRFDYFAKSVPLVPYAKAGFVAMPWWVTTGGKTETADGSRAAGVNFGYFGTIGLSFLLDVLDQRLSKDFDNSIGVNHSYIFAEYSYQQVNDFKPPGNGSFDLSTKPSTAFMFGLAFEF